MANPRDFERGTLERSLPYTAAAFVRGDRAHIFDGTEAAFPAWKWRLEHRLTKMKLDHTLVRTPTEEVYAKPTEGATPEEEQARQAKYIKRLDDDVEALDEIVMMVSNEVLNKLIGLEYAKQAMDMLVRTYQKVGTGAMISMRDRLFSIKSRKFESLSTLFDEYDMIVRELERMGADLSAGEKIHALLIALPPRLNHVKGALTVLPNDELCKKSLTEIKRMFLDAEIVESSTKEEGRNIALKTNKKDQNKCFGCGELGHYKNKCPKFKVQKKKQKGYAMLAGIHKKKKKVVRFIVDSGATEHMVNDERLLQKIETLKHPVKIATAKSGESLLGTKKGKVVLKSVVGCNKIKKNLNCTTFFLFRVWNPISFRLEGQVPWGKG